MNVPVPIAVTLPFAVMIASIVARSSVAVTTCASTWIGPIGVGRFSATVNSAVTHGGA